MSIRLIFNISLLFFFFSCSTVSKTEMSNQQRFENGESYFLKNKFEKAKNEFEIIIQNEQGTNLGLESTFYLAKALFELKEYDESLYHFNYYSMFSKDIDKIEFAQFMKCRCSFKLTTPYDNDQTQSILSISIIQEFLDNFPHSKYKSDAIEMIKDLRNKISKKHYEIGRLYLKMKEFEAAFYYFDIILSEYYDTNYHDEAIISYIFTYILMEDYDKAKNYFEINKNNFNSDEKVLEAEMILNEYEDGLGIKGLFRLYK